MRLIIAGTRTFKDYKILETDTLQFLKKYKIIEEPVEIISGHANGADKLGEKFASKYGLKLNVLPAQWSRLGPAAGHIRNQKMAESASHCIVFWDGKSPGTKNMIEIAKKKNLILKVITYENTHT